MRFRDAGLAIVGPVLATVLNAGLGPAHAGLVYLLAVASVASVGGTRVALAASFLSFGLWDFFFLEPRFTLVVNASNDWLLLISFLVIAILVGQMTGRLRAREEEALSRERDTAALYSSSQAVGAQMDLEQALPTLVEQIVSHTRARCCAVFRAGRPVATAGDLDEARLMPLVARVEHGGIAIGLAPPPAQTRGTWPVSIPHPEQRLEILLPLSTRDHVIGVLYASSAQAFSSEDCRLLVAFASQAAAFIERWRLQREAATLAAQQEEERMRAVLFSSLSHNLKTPLASLRATLSSLRCDDVEWDPSQLRESLDYMTEDLGRLTEHIENLLSLAQLETGNWKPRREWLEVGELVDIALRLLGEREAQRIALRMQSDLMVAVDSVQMAQVIRHLVENALVYSPSDTEVSMSVTAVAGALEIAVDDRGPGIPEDERQTIFRKFYRGTAARHGGVRGTGLGLAICSEIVRAHGGTIVAEPSTLGGARLRVQLPLEQPLSPGEEREQAQNPRR